MKILYITDEDGGAMNWLLSVKKPASKLGHETALLDAQEIKPPNYSQYGLKLKMEDLRDTLETFDPDIVHVFNFCLWGEGLFDELEKRSIPAVLSMPDFALICQNRMFYQGPFTKLCDTNEMHTACSGCKNFCLSIKSERKKLLERMKDVRIIVGAAFMKDIFCSYGYSEERVTMIELGIDPSKYEPSYEFGSDVIINLNRMAYEKGIDIYDNLAVLNGKHEWLIAGAPALRDEAVSALKRAKYIGVLSEDEKVRELRRADVFCSVPRWYEPIGITYLEAKACGRPVVCNDMGGLRQYHGREDSGSRVFSDGDLKSVSDYIDYLISDENELRRMGRDGRKQIETRQNQNNIIHEIIEVYDEELGKR
jgi:glycosyltransferase involved in cell wall biosynthesis